MAKWICKLCYKPCELKTDVIGGGPEPLLCPFTGCWKIRHDHSVAWWDGETVRGGVKFYRIFGPGEVAPEEEEYELELSSN